MALKDTEIFSHKEIVNASIAEKEKGCWECAGLNCLIKQNLYAKYKVKRQFDGDCKGNKSTFGDLSKYGVAKSPSAGGNTTNIKPPAVIDYDSDSAALRENMAIFWESQEAHTEEFGYSENVVEMYTIRPVITRENMPNASLLEQTADIRDKYCVICPKGGYNFEDMDNHYDRYHGVFLVDETTYEHWKEAEELYNDGYRPHYSDSDGGEDYPIDIGTKSDVPHEKSSSKSTVRSSGDSSDSSTSGASSGQRKSKKSASQRFSKKFDNKLNQFKTETGQLIEDQLCKIKSEIVTNSNLSDTALETIKEEIISNTVQISESKDKFSYVSVRY